MATTSAFLVASNTNENVSTSISSPAKLPVFPPDDVVKAQASMYYSPIHTAIYNPKLTVADIESIILAYPSCVHANFPQNGYTPLHAAVRRANIGMIKLIVEHGGNIEAKASEGETPLIVACQVSVLLFVACVCVCVCVVVATNCTVQM